MRKGIFRCGTCNLYEEGLTDNEILLLSRLHFNNNHLDIDEAKEYIKLQKKTKSSKEKIK